MDHIDRPETLHASGKDTGQKHPSTSGKKEITPAQETPAAAAAAKTKTGSKKNKEPSVKTRSRKNSPGSGQGTIIPNVQSLAASATAGEIDFGVMDLPGFSGITEPITKTLSPIAGIFHGIGSYITGIFRIFKNPGALIGTLVMAALYVFLALNRGSNLPIIKWLSLLTYAEGGFDRGGLNSVQGILGTIGGTIGKGTTAAALLSLFNGGLLNVFKGVGALFTGHGEKRSFLSLLFGILLGGAAYLAFTGRQPSEGAFIPGISGALFSLEALGSGKGKLYTLAQSLTSRTTDGIRTAARGKCDSLLTGLSIGFSIAAIVSVIM